ncbi:MarR family winged helix-turn-helix transcriptional regulator [Latilactobacillus graminis]|uniref:MarR family protein n=2 Tax=Latilactobacillus graminis TaxID=60519 RepID=A0AA89I8H1_9LACO|nr:MarR family transcriptional regulator [Latilactobacillus graminis]KRM23820.1 marR family protein [Latilactobacillus graminis DSM 20719]QFP79711.1 MarR family transcriptional regulator [Latilactobacillus graminis]
MKTKRGGYLTLKIRLFNTRLFNRYLLADPRAQYNAEQGKILSALWDNHPQTATELAQVTGLANSSLSLMLHRLEDQQLLVSEQSLIDKRKRVFDLTPLGASQQEVGEYISKRLSAVFYKGFSDAEVIAVDEYLERILANLEAEAGLFNRQVKDEKVNNDSQTTNKN